MLKYQDFSVFSAVIVIFTSLFISFVHAERIKDITRVKGVRENPLVGYGIVVGLNGTGDNVSQTAFTLQSIENMLSRFGVKIPPGANPRLKNVAAVIVHATLPAFGKPGQTIDVTVSSIGNADSLHGGSLLMSPLMGADGQVYALAQGNLVVGGFGVKGKDGSKITVNIPSTGRIPNGAIIERESPGSLSANEGFITLNLKQPDFTTAQRLCAVLDNTFGEGTAKALDAASVVVQAPFDFNKKVAFIAALENLEVKPGESKAKVIVNSRTGTVVIGNNVRVLPAAVSHGSLTVTIKEKVSVNQPNSFSEGQTAVTTNSNLNIEQAPSRMFLMDTGVTLDQIVDAINSVGAGPSDLVAILEALDQLGALRAELIII